MENEGRSGERPLFFATECGEGKYRHAPIRISSGMNELKSQEEFMDRDKKQQGREGKETNEKRDKNNKVTSIRTGSQEPEPKDPFDEGDNAKAE